MCVCLLLVRAKANLTQCPCARKKTIQQGRPREEATLLRGRIIETIRARASRVRAQAMHWHGGSVCLLAAALAAAAATSVLAPASLSPLPTRVCAGVGLRCKIPNSPRFRPDTFVPDAVRAVAILSLGSCSCDRASQRRQRFDSCFPRRSRARAQNLADSGQRSYMAPTSCEMLWVSSASLFSGCAGLWAERVGASDGRALDLRRFCEHAHLPDIYFQVGASLQTYLLVSRRITLAAVLVLGRGNLMGFALACAGVGAAGSRIPSMAPPALRERPTTSSIRGSITRLSVSSNKRWPC